MTASIIDGKKVAQTIRQEIAKAIAADVGQGKARPGLAAILVGENPASQVYVRNKRKACDEIGMANWLHAMPASMTQAELLTLIDQLNRDPAVSGILVQLPLPPQIDENVIIKAVSPMKDVDGFGPESLGLLTAGKPRFVACTPLGIQQLLMRSGVNVDGAHVVILGRSNIVGKPLGLLLMQKGPGGNATVTVCHSRSRRLPDLTRQGDVVVAAIGQAQFLKKDMVRPGAVVIDVGINRLPDGKIVGDVDYGPVSEVASAITPVPGGVGPMTIAMLLSNTLQAVRLQQ